MIEIVKQILVQSIYDLYDGQPDINVFTSQTSQTEWNLGHHYANEVSKYMPFLNHDVDLIKPNEGDKRPDIVFHKRGTNLFNFLVIELKRDGYANEINLSEDFKKVKTFWMGNDLKYRFGASIGIKDKFDFDIRICERGKEGEPNTIKSNNADPYQIDNANKIPVINLTKKQSKAFDSIYKKWKINEKALNEAITEFNNMIRKLY